MQAERSSATPSNFAPTYYFRPTKDGTLQKRPTVKDYLAKWQEERGNTVGDELLAAGIPTDLFASGGQVRQRSSDNFRDSHEGGSFGTQSEEDIGSLLRNPYEKDAENETPDIMLYSGDLVEM